MAFIAPLMLIGLAGLALPVIVHLMDRARSLPEDWPSLRFLRIAHEHSAHKTRLKHLLVLLARCMLLALIVLAMAQPYVQHDEWAEPAELPTTLVIVLDNSYSMGCRDAGPDTTRFDQAKKLALAQITKLSLTDEVALVLASDKPELLIDRPTRDHEKVRSLIQDAALSTRPTDLGAALVAAFAVGGLDAVADPEVENRQPDQEEQVLRKQRKAWRHVLLLTDMQRSGWHTMIEADLMEQVADPLPVTVVETGDRQTANRFIRQVRVRQDAVGTTLPVEVQIVNDRPGSLAGGQATLWIDGQRAGSPELIPPSSGKITLNAPLPSPGVHTCMVQLEDDRLPVDDRRFFSLNIGAAGHMTILDGDPSDVPRLSETFYLKGALTVAGARGGDLTIDELDAEQLASATLSQSSCLILANVGQLDGSALTNVENFLRAGGNVLVTLGDKVDIDHYNQHWRFLPVKLDKRLGDPNRSRAYALVVERPNHPAIGGELDLAATRFFAFIGSNPQTLRKGAKTIISFSNGSPAMIEGTFGGDGDDATAAAGGRVLLLTGPIDADWSNLPQRRAFVPLVDRVTGYLTRKRMTSRGIVVGQPIRFTGPSTLDRKPVTITSPGQTVRTLYAQLDEKTKQAVIDFRDTDQMGLYRVEADAGFAAGGAFAVNADTSESILTRVDGDRLRKAFKDRTVRFVQSQPTDVTSWHTAYDDQKTKDRTEYWPQLLAAAMVIFAIETLLANFFTRRQSVTPPPTTEYIGRRRSEGVLSGRLD